MTDQRIQEIRARCEAATPGPGRKNQMARCKKYGEENCTSLYYCTSDGENATADGRPMQKYFTMNIRKIIHGKQTLNPAVYLCPKCFRETKLALLLCDMDMPEKEEV